MTSKSTLAFFLLASSILSASLDERLITLENWKNEKMSPKPVQIVPTQETHNPPARPIVTGLPDVFVMGELLLLKPVQGGMEFAYLSDGGAGAYVGTPRTGTSVVTTFGRSTRGQPVHGTIRSGVGKWDWGFRLGAGYNFQRDGWDVTGTWMRFHTLHSKSNRPNNHGAPLIPLIAPPWNTTNGVSPLATGATLGRLFLVDKARARWKLNIDMIDVELGKEYWVSQWVTLRPFAGPRAAFIPQSMRASFYGGTLVSNFVGDAGGAGSNLNLEPRSVMRVHLINNFWGCGPRAGLGTTWGLTYGITAYGNVDFSFLWGSFHRKTRFDIFPQSAAATTVANIRNHHMTMRPITNLTLGARYEHHFDDDYHLNVFIGYEHDFFWGQSEFMKFNNASTVRMNAVNENLALAGLHLGALFDF